MPVDWIWGLLGGLLIGCGGAVYLLGNGRIMGASGILGGLIDGSGRDNWNERALFVIGLIALPAVLYLFGVGTMNTGLTSNIVLVVLAGLLVGVGTRIGSGCTSGHGVCGISRLSPRGIVATLIYIAAGAGIVVLMRHGMGVL